MNILNRLVRVMPTLLLSLILAVLAWVSAVTSSDPVQERTFPRTVTIEWVGQNPSMVLMNTPPEQVTLTLNAPRSVWDRLLTEENPVRAIVDVSGVGAGTHKLPVQIQVGTRLVKVVSYSPITVQVEYDSYVSRSLPIRVVRRGDPAVGFQAETPQLSQNTIKISGPQAKINSAQEARVTLDISQASEAINRTLPVDILDANESVIKGISLSPERVVVTENIVQLGGYRTVVVKVALTGQVSNGYRLTNIWSSPPAITVFATDPQLVNNLPGYIETTPLNLNGAKDYREVRLPLNLPNGISVVGDPTVQVQVGITSIQSSLTLNNIPIEITGLKPTFLAKSSPDKVDVIVSGPVPLLERLSAKDVRVVLDFSDISDLTPGKYQRTPKVIPSEQDVRVESILPGSVEVTISLSPTPTPTPTQSPTPRR